MPPRPRHPLRQATLEELPDWCVLNTEQTSKATGLSKDTLRRLDERREGPPRTKLSARRFGYTVGNLRGWLQKRGEQSEGTA